MDVYLSFERWDAEDGRRGSGRWCRVRLDDGDAGLSKVSVADEDCYGVPHLGCREWAAADSWLWGSPAVFVVRAGGSGFWGQVMLVTDENCQVSHRSGA